MQCNVICDKIPTKKNCCRKLFRTFHSFLSQLPAACTCQVSNMLIVTTDTKYVTAVNIPHPPHPMIPLNKCNGAHWEIVGQSQNFSLHYTLVAKYFNDHITRDF